MNWSEVKAKGGMRGFLAISTLLCFMIALLWLMKYTVPDGNVQLVTYMLGQLSMITAGCVGFYTYTSKSSADKNEMIDDMQDRFTPPKPPVIFDEPKNPPDLTGKPTGDLSSPPLNEEKGLNP